MKLTTHYPKKNMQPTAKSCRFANAANAPSWETWHWRFGHISYSGLQQLLDMNLVTGFDVDESSPKPDCPACTKAKQSEEPYRSVSKRATKPGEFTHMDLWGKYEINSINGRRYHILFVNDYFRRISVRFLKGKSEAAQQDYIAHLKARHRDTTDWTLLSCTERCCGTHGPHARRDCTCNAHSIELARVTVGTRRRACGISTKYIVHQVRTGFHTI